MTDATQSSTRTYSYPKQKTPSAVRALSTLSRKAHQLMMSTIIK